MNNIDVLNGLPVRKKGFGLDHRKKNLGLFWSSRQYCCVSPRCECDEWPAEGAIAPPCMMERALKCKTRLDFHLLTASKYQTITQIINERHHPGAMSDIYSCRSNNQNRTHQRKTVYDPLSLGLTPPNPIDAVLLVEPLPKRFLQNFCFFIHFGGFCAVISNQ